METKKLISILGRPRIEIFVTFQAFFIWGLFGVCDRGSVTEVWGNTRPRPPLHSHADPLARVLCDRYDPCRGAVVSRSRCGCRLRALLEIFFDLLHSCSTDNWCVHCIKCSCSFEQSFVRVRVTNIELVVVALNEVERSVS